MGSTATTDIIVAGTGPAGLAAALAFADNGFAVTLAGPAPNAGDRRTTALMAPSLAFLGRLGLREALTQKAAPLRAMRIVDATARLVRSPTVTFRAAEIGEEAFGYNIPNVELNRILGDAVAAHAGITWKKALVADWALSGEAARATLADGTVAAGSLAVAADGRNSPARAAAGIRTHQRRHPQAALVLNFAHERDHGSVSTEFHTETGPFTQVPLPGRRSSLVWVVHPGTAETLMELGDAALSLRIEERMQSMLGKVAVEPGRQVYPLSSALPARFAARRVALVGEAAHIFPPIGAQGLNLGIRDVEDLVTVAAAGRGDPGAPAVLARYDGRRRPDILARTGAVNLLNLSLLSDFLPAQILRGAGLGLLGSLPPLRGFFMREGLRPGSGWKSLLPRSGKKVAR